MKYDDLLQGGDRRSIGKANEVAKSVATQNDFDALFEGLYHPDRNIAMRVADAVEKVSLDKPSYLEKHKARILDLFYQATHIELRWHLALLVSRLNLTRSETGAVWRRLSTWAQDLTESRIVRVNSIQAMFTLAQADPELRDELQSVVEAVTQENVPSLNARIRRLKIQHKS